jgi:hypothetical protein
MRHAALIFLMLLSVVAHAQRISGIVVDMNGAPMSDVGIQNIHSEERMLTGVDGRFSIGAKAGQLVEFHKIGYRTARTRIGAGALPPFYKIILEPGVQELSEVQVRDRFQDFRHDSLYYHELFKKQIDYPVLTGWRAFQSPFSALGKTNQNMLRFQKEYAWLEQQKYIDYTFNEKLIAQLTGLKGDSAQQYMRRFRPSYELLRAMPEYDFFSYVKQTVQIWRDRQRFGPGNSRGSGGG